MRTNHACPVQVKDAVPSLVLGAKRVYCIFAEFDAPYLTSTEIATYGWWAGTKDVVHDPSRTGYDCVVGLRYTGAPLDIMPHLAFGPAGLMGVRFAWLDTSFEEGEFNVFRRSNSEPVEKNDRVADVSVPSPKCGSVVAPLSFTDPDTGLTPGARVVYTVVAKPKRLIDSQDANLDTWTSSKKYTVPWLSLLTVIVEAEGTKTPVGRVEIALSHMFDRVNGDPSYERFLFGLTDDAGAFVAQIRVVDVDWFKETQLFKLEPKLVENGVEHVFAPPTQIVAVPHIYGQSASFTDTTVIAVRGYVRFGGGDADADPSRDADGHFVDCGDQVLPSYALEQSKGRCYCALPAGQIIKVLRQSGETETYETDDRGYYSFTPMMYETLVVTYEGYEAGNAAGHDVHFTLLDDVGDVDAKRTDVDATAPSITFKAGTDDVWLDFVSSTLREMNIKIGGGFVAESGQVTTTTTTTTTRISYHKLGEKSFSDCDTSCAADGMTMPCVTSAEENAALLAELRANGDGSAWLGMESPPDKDSSVLSNWAWNSGCVSSYTNWHAGEPNDAQGTEDWAWIDVGRNGQWNDVGSWSGETACYCQALEGGTSAP